MARPPPALSQVSPLRLDAKVSFFTTLKIRVPQATSLHADEVRGMRPFLHVPARPLPSTDKTRPSLAHARS